MAGQEPWYDNDEFWRVWESVMFNPRRLAATPQEVEQVVTLMGLTPGAHVLDLCCGIGRHTLELARCGFRVIGVDRTVYYLDKAREAARKTGLDVEFVQEDMRRFVRPAAFDAVLSLFTSFGYFEEPDDDRRVVSNMHASLKPGGRFLIDVRGKESLARDFRERDWRVEGDAIILEERKLTENWGRIENRWILFKEGKRYENRLSTRLYSASELETLLKSCGFASVDVYGDLIGAPYDQNARRLVVVGEK